MTCSTLSISPVHSFFISLSPSLVALFHTCVCPPICLNTLDLLQLKFKRYLACARNKLWWMTPEWGTSLHTLPPETQFLLLQLEDEGQQAAAGSSSSDSSGGGRYAVVLPLIDGDFRATCRPNRCVIRVVKDVGIWGEVSQLRNI